MKTAIREEATNQTSQTKLHTGVGEDIDKIRSSISFGVILGKSSDSKFLAINSYNVSDLRPSRSAMLSTHRDLKVSLLLFRHYCARCYQVYSLGAQMNKFLSSIDHGRFDAINGCATSSCQIIFGKVCMKALRTYCQNWMCCAQSKSYTTS